MANFADWTTLIYNNGDTPAINAVNLNKNENALEKVMDELNYSKGFAFEYVKEYGYLRNSNLIDDLETLSSWSTSGTVTATQEYAVVHGKAGVKCTETDNTSGTLTLYKSISSLDLTKFLNGDSAPSNVYVCLLYYVSDNTLINFIRVKLGADSSNYFRFGIANTNFSTGWNHTDMREDFFTQVGTVSWNDIQYISLEIDTNSNASGEYVVFNKLLLVQRDSVYFSGNPFLYDDGSGNFDTEPYVVPDVGSYIMADNKLGKIGNLMYDDAIYPNMNEIFCTVNSFYFKGEAFSKYASHGMALQWYIDSSNYIIVGIESDSFFIIDYASGAGGVVASESVTLPYDGRHELEVEKVEDIVRARLIIDGEPEYYLDYETSISSNTAGCVGFVKMNVNSYYFITDYVISHNRAILPMYKGSGKILFKVKLIDEDASTTTLSNDDELFIYLPPNSLYEVEVVLIVDGVDDATDIKVDWSYTGMNYVTRKCSRGIGTSSTSVDNSGSMNNQAKAATSQNEFGVVTSGWNYISEVSIFKVSESGATLNVQHANLNSTANNATIKESSYIKATRID